MIKLRVSVLACAVALASLAGCGGSSGSDSSSGGSSSSVNNGGSAGLTVSGVAAQGAPLVGIAVSVTDANGQVTQSAPTDANGNFTVGLSGQAPYVLTAPATDADGTPTVLSSVIDPASNSGSTIANLNPLTSLITQRALGVTLTDVPSAAQISAANITPGSIAAATTYVTSALQPLFTALSVPSSQTANPIQSAYVANATNLLDTLFDIAPISVHANSVTVANPTTPAQPYVYQLPLPPAGSQVTPNNIQAFPSGAITEAQALASGSTVTPIQHVIVIIGENQTFDGLFGTYQAPTGQSVKNLLSEGIVNADGSPGPNFVLAAQNQATGGSTYTIDPPRTGTYASLIPPLNTGIVTIAGLETYLTSGQGAPISFLFNQADGDFPKTLPNGPFQITTNASNGSLVSYTAPSGTAVGSPSGSLPYIAQAPLYAALGEIATTGDPVHRFFQMWQQTGGDNAKLDLFNWVASTAGQGGDTFENAPGSNQITAATPGQGGELMGFMNMAAGDAPYWKSLAQQGALSDNYHQAILGGTGMNFFSIATADSPWFNSNGAVATPPANQIENPNPVQGNSANTNFYTQDGYEGGSYVNCSDSSQPGVAAILKVLAAKHVASNCEAGKYYLVNNYNPGYTPAGTVQPIGANDYNYPPQTVPTIGEALSAKGVSWGWYTSARDIADVTAQATSLATTLGVPSAATSIAGLLASAEYNNIGDPMVASTNVMTNSALSNHLQDQTSFMAAAVSGTLPAVSFLVPPNTYSGHPGNSSPAAFEGWLKQVLSTVQGSSQWANTAIILTTDEGGGHFDTGPIQNLDFFGDGPRIPMIVLSPYAKTNTIDHTYNDHASILKFIEHNWRLAPLSSRSRDRLPNAAMLAKSYLPANHTPAVGNLTTMFNF